MKFAAFIITYERPQQVLKMIEKLFQQTMPPQAVLIVDNSSTNQTRQAVDKLQDDRVNYLGVGYNSGPAGGAYYGLKKLAEEGYDWILWMDDDDYPSQNNIIERLFKLTEQRRVTDRIGMIGAVGTDFDFSKGEMRRVTDEELLQHDFLNVYSVAGGMMPIINRQVIEENILPDKELFFGFEELDFCLRVRKANFNIVVSTEIMIEKRKAGNRWGLKQSHLGNLSLMKEHSIWRQYYSVRNMTYLFSHKYFSIAVLVRYFVKFSAKSILSFRRGWKFGISTSYYVFLGYLHGLIGKLGRVVLPVSK